MNNKMAKNTNLSTIEFKNKLSKSEELRDRIMNTESIFNVAKWEGGMGE